MNSRNTIDNRYLAPVWAIKIERIVRYITEDFLGGEKQIPMAWAINFHKIVTLFLIFGLMFYFDNFSNAAWVYLGLHGVYGYCWMIKDIGFRDASFDKLITIHGGVLLYPLLVGWYWLLPYLFISQHTQPSGIMLFVGIALHTLGITWMIAADCQKHFSLKYRPGLITSGVFKYTRNPNFLGEIMIYLAYAVLVNHWLGYLVLAYGIIYFYSRMLVKDASISRYPGWQEYAQQSSRLVPWKALLAGTRIDSPKSQV